MWQIEKATWETISPKEVIIGIPEETKKKKNTYSAYLVGEAI